MSNPLDTILLNQGKILRKLSELEMPPPTGSARLNKEFMDRLTAIQSELEQINKKLDRR